MPPAFRAAPLFAVTCLCLGSRLVRADAGLAGAALEEIFEDDVCAMDAQECGLSLQQVRGREVGAAAPREDVQLLSKRAESKAGDPIAGSGAEASQLEAQWRWGKWKSPKWKGGKWWR